jgi:tetrapyrrole methylase family protein/MazG family protein
MTGITLLGLGPGNPKYLTNEAMQWLTGVVEVYISDPRHPALSAFPANVKIINLEDLVPLKGGDQDRTQQHVDRILEIGKRTDGITFADMGHPCRDSVIGREVFRQAAEQDIPIKVVAGLSWSELVIQMTGHLPPTQLTILNAQDLIGRHMPGFPPNHAAVISPVDTTETSAELQQILLNVYPPEHPLTLIQAAGQEVKTESVKLDKLDKCSCLSSYTSLYIEPMDENSAFESFQEIVARLRAPDGCPWDREQTHESLRQHLLEESYETLEAIDSGNRNDLREELGDLLLQIVLNAQIAGENKHFNMAQVIDGISTKLINRHPHVFGDFKVEGVGGVLKNWEKLKEAERQQNGNQKKGLLDGAPASLPALAYSHEIQDRAARVGFDWPEIEGVIAKVHEELEEVLAAKTDADREGEIGDLAFAVVNLARWLKVDPESALRGSNQRFKKRFSHIEDTARDRGVSLGDLGFEEMDRLWEDAKRK